MKVFKVTHEGTVLYTPSLTDVSQEIEYSSETESHYDIDVIEMSQEEIDSLPEFDGF